MKKYMFNQQILTTVMKKWHKINISIALVNKGRNEGLKQCLHPFLFTISYLGVLIQNQHKIWLDIRSLTNKSNASNHNYIRCKLKRSN